MSHLASLLDDPRRRRTWFGLLCACVLTSAVFAFAPRPLGGASGGGDKLMHAMAFAAMAWCWSLAGTASRARAVAASIALLAWGVAIEAVQSQLPARTADAADVVADAVGIVTGLALAALLRRVPRRR